MNNSSDSGCYFLILRLENDLPLKIGKLGPIDFVKGYYVYVGSARLGLKKRIHRHKKMDKRLFWHIDYFTLVTKFIDAIPVIINKHIECFLSYQLEQVSDWQIIGFGCSDCHCQSHLYGFHNNPKIKIIDIVKSVYE